MRWREGRRSENVVDRRAGGRGIALGGSVGVLVLALVAWLLGADPGAVLQLVGEAGKVSAGAPLDASQESSGEAEQREFVSAVLADTEDVWHALLDGGPRPYVEPELVLFRDGVRSGCGLAGAAVGPFYCPADGRVYLDLSFFDELERRFGAPGDFARAYVIAHEVGHHVQRLLGLSAQVAAAQRSASEAEANALSVRLELQADYLAGVWAHHAQRARAVLEPGDLEEALHAASRIGDDVLAREAGRRAVPESFTHGSAAQRVRWFRRGFESGDPGGGDTFALADDEL